MRRWRTTEHENGLQKSGVISYHSFDGQPSFSLGTDVVDPLTMNLLSSAKSLRPVLVPARRIYFQSRHGGHRGCTKKLKLRHYPCLCFIFELSGFMVYWLPSATRTVETQVSDGWTKLGAL